MFGVNSLGGPRNVVRWRFWFRKGENSWGKFQPLWTHYISQEWLNAKTSNFVHISTLGMAIRLTVGQISCPAAGQNLICLPVGQITAHPAASADRYLPCAHIILCVDTFADCKQWKFPCLHRNFLFTNEKVITGIGLYAENICMLKIQSFTFVLYYNMLPAITFKYLHKAISTKGHVLCY